MTPADLLCKIDDISNLFFIGYIDAEEAVERIKALFSANKMTDTANKMTIFLDKNS